MNQITSYEYAVFIQRRRSQTHSQHSAFSADCLFKIPFPRVEFPPGATY